MRSGDRVVSSWRRFLCPVSGDGGDLPLAPRLPSITTLIFEDLSKSTNILNRSSTKLLASVCTDMVKVLVIHEVNFSLNVPSCKKSRSSALHKLLSSLLVLSTLFNSAIIYVESTAGSAVQLQKELSQASVQRYDNEDTLGKYKDVHWFQPFY